MTFKSPVHRGGPRRGVFDQFAEYASNFTSSPVFFLVCLLLVGFFVSAHAARLDVELLLLAGESMTAVTLLLLALLKNSEMRAEHAIQRKLDALARALLEMNKDDHSPAFEELRNSIRMEEET
jgi:low affinity Fe/Cu permease